MRFNAVPLTAFFLFVVAIIFVHPISTYAETIEPEMEMQEEPREVHRAEVVEVDEGETVDASYWSGGVTQLVTVRFVSGPRAGEEMLIENQLMDNPAYDIEVSEGDLVLVGESMGDFYIQDFARDISMAWLVGIFMVGLVIVGGLKGARIIVTLALTGLAVYYVLIPRVLAGQNPVVITLLTSAAVVAVTTSIMMGLKSKTLAAAVGTVVGVGAAALVANIFASGANLMGLHTQEAQMLYFGSEFAVDFRGLLLSGMILGALGAIMDVCVSIASSVEEVYRANPDLTLLSLFKSGFNVGRDVLGTMSNTLILAYAGGTLPLLLLLSVHNAEVVEILNMDIIATEVVRALSGSIGMVLCVPATAFLAALLQGQGFSISQNKTTQN